MDLTHIHKGDTTFNIRVSTNFQDTAIVDEIYGGDDYEVRELKKNGVEIKTILDIGGHIGSFGVLAKQLWPDARLIAVEPFAENAELYRMNLKANGLDGTVIEKAISYNKDCCWLVDSVRTTGGNFVRTRFGAERDIADQRISSENMYHVDVTTIEEIFEEFDIDCVDLAKWDCEGGEIEAWDNISPAIARKFRFMVGETHIGKKGADSNLRLLCAPFFYWWTYWRKVVRKFDHLEFEYERRPMGHFKAWPKDLGEYYETTNDPMVAGHSDAGRIVCGSDSGCDAENPTRSMVSGGDHRRDSRRSRRGSGNHRKKLRIKR